jgi:antitoxin ParD1/3/4
MNVSIGPRWETFIDDLVKAGRYATASEVMRDALRLVEERETKLQALKDTIRASMERGGRNTSEDVRAFVEADLEAWATSQKKAG